MSSEIKVDTISEKTSAAGVTIDGVLLKDGEVDGVDVSAIVSGSLVKIDDHDFSTATSVTRDSVFSSTYNNYKIFINITDGSATTVQCAIRLRASSTSTTSNYVGHRNYVYTGGTATHGNSFGTTYLYLGDVSSSQTDATCSDITLFAPNLAAPTKYLANGQGFYNTDFYSQQIYGFQSDNTQFDGIELYTFAPGGATITGNVQIFGIKQ
jgi:hypothetical protein